MNTIKSFFLLSIIILVGCSQPIMKEKLFEYKNLISDDPIQEFNFISKRVYKNDSIFTDNAIFCQSEHPECGVKFLKTGQNWFIYNGNRWNMFYSKKDNSLLKQNLPYCNSFLQPITESDKPILLKTTLAFELKKKGMESDHLNRYFFDANLGIVAIESNLVTLIRTDYIKN